MRLHFKNDLNTPLSEMSRIVALIRVEGNVTKYWHWRALRTLGVVCVEDMSISHKA